MTPADDVIKRAGGSQKGSGTHSGRGSDDLLTLYEVADRLGVHYMTAYRYVRTGRLPGRKAGVEWRVRAPDVAAFAARGDDPDDRRPVRPADERANTPTDEAPANDTAGAAPLARPAAPRRRVDHARRLADRLVAGDESGSWAIVEAALASGTEPDALYLDVLTPALAAIGEGWKAGFITVGQEHQASVVVHRIIGRLGPRFARRGRTRGTIVVGAPSGDYHALPSALFADLLRGEGFAVIDLGADTPAASFADAARGAERLLAVGLTVTAPDRDQSVRDVVAALRACDVVPIVLGGGAASAEAAERLGTDGWGGEGRDALARFAALADDAGRRRRRTTRRETS